MSAARSTGAMNRMTHSEWNAVGAALFGADKMAWKFVCPCCGHVATPADYKAAGSPERAVAFSCVGRWCGTERGAFGDGPGPCDYAGGGLFGLNPVTVVDEDGREHALFAFAEVTPS